MPEPTNETARPTAADQPSAPVETDETGAADALVEQDLLVEDVSIDGMCGVY